MVGAISEKRGTHDHRSAGCVTSVCSVTKARQQVADTLGIKQATVSRYEADEMMPTPDVHERLAEYLGPLDR